MSVINGGSKMIDLDGVFNLGLCFLFMAIAHELGHFITLKILKVKDIKWETPFRISYPFNALSKDNKIIVLIMGIFTGVLPMFFFNFNIFGGAALLAGYSCFITKDLKRLGELGLRWPTIKEVIKFLKENEIK